MKRFATALFLTLTAIMLVLWPLLLLSGCSEPEPTENAKAERASVVVMHQVLTIGEPGDIDRLDLVPACGGVAIGKRLIVTAAHCVLPGGTDHYPIVTRDLWFTTSDASIDAIVVERDEGRDIAWIETYEDLAHWTELAPVASSPPNVLLVRYFETSRARFDGIELEGGRFSKGDSGAGAFDDFGALLGVISACPDQGGDGVCDFDRARLVRP